MSNPIVLTVDVVSDVVCPWCFLGKRRLERAAEQVPEVQLQIRWRPYQLDPTVPPEGLDRERYMLSKFGSAQRIADVHRRLEDLGAAEGIPYAFGKIRVAPNTLDAHRLIRWSDEAGRQGEVVERLFNQFFVLGGDLSNPATLIAVANESGLDGDEVGRRLASDLDRQEILDEIAQAQQIGVTGVPCFILDNKYAVMGAQESSTLADAFRTIASEKMTGSAA